MIAKTNFHKVMDNRCMAGRVAPRAPRLRADLVYPEIISGNRHI